MNLVFTNSLYFRRSGLPDYTFNYTQSPLLNVKSLHAERFGHLVRHSGRHSTNFSAMPTLDAALFLRPTSNFSKVTPQGTKSPITLLLIRFSEVTFKRLHVLHIYIPTNNFSATVFIFQVGFTAAYRSLKLS
jgi:hypothetical protein